MNKIFADSEEKYLMGVVLYAGSDNVLRYTSAESEDKVLTDDLVNLYNKGLVKIEDSSENILTPVACAVSAGVATLTCVTGTGSTATFTAYKSVAPTA